MNIEQQSLVTIIKSALTGVRYALPKEMNFDRLCEIAKAHGISAILYYGALNCGVDQNCEAMQKLFYLTCTYISASERQLFMIKNICNAFEEQGISYMPLKGIVLKSLYPKSEMRIMSDADILIRMYEYPKIKEIMLSLGFREGDVSDHEIQWHHESLYVELHRRLIPSYNKDYYAYFGDGWQLAKEKETNCRYRMNGEDELIYLFTHFSKHYRDAGIGIKHILDIWVFLQHNKTLDNEYIKKELKKLQLYEFYLNILDTLGAWFSGKELNEKTEFITQVIFGSGAAGTYESAVLSSALKLRGQNVTGNTRFKKIYNTIFKPFDKMCEIYPILKKAPIILPVFWAGNIIEVLKRKGASKVLGDFKTISDKNVENYKKALNFVDLDFNFKE